MKFVTILVLMMYCVVGKQSKKSKRGTKLWGKEALPHSLDAVDAKCSCTTSSNCWLVGDPHLKSFYNRYEKISYPVGEEFDIYTHEDFPIRATTYGPDLMDNIKFGPDTEWHISDCKKQGWIDKKVHRHTYFDGSTIEAKVYCKKAKGKMHINILLTKKVPLKEAMSFDDYESVIGSTGECTKKKV